MVVKISHIEPGGFRVSMEEGNALLRDLGLDIPPPGGNVRLTMVNLVGLPRAPRDGLFFQRCSHFWKLNCNGGPFFGAHEAEFTRK